MVVVVRWECVKSLWAISKVCGKRGTVSSFHAFHQTGISTAACQPRFRFEAWTINSSRSLLVTEFLAVGHDLRLVLAILLRLDDRQYMAEALVLDDCGAD